MSTTDPVVELENVEVGFTEETALMEAVPQRVKQRFGWESTPLKAVDDVSFEIGEQEVLAVVGESGSGKTTLGKTTVALEEPTAGSIRYRGRDIWEVKRKTQVDDLFFEDIRKALQIVHQDPGASLNPYRTVMASLREPLNLWYPELTSADKRERILEMFRQVGLTPAREYENRYPHQLSGGEQQRVALVRAMLLEPDLILADEVVSALDPSLRVEIMDLMLDLRETFNTSYLFVTHNLANAKYLAGKADGRIAVMYLGEIVEMGPVEEVIENPSHPYTKILKWGILSSHPDRARDVIRTESPLREFEPPDITNPPSGCRFHTRCPKAREACTAEAPELFSAGENHRAACYRELPDHEYWDTEFLDEEGERDIPT